MNVIEMTYRTVGVKLVDVVKNYSARFVVLKPLPTHPTMFE